MGELQDRFDQKELLPPVLALESVIVKAANDEDYVDTVKSLKESCYSGDMDFPVMRRHLPLLYDAVRKSNPAVKKVTSVRTLCEAMNRCSAYKSVLSDVHKLFRLYLTVLITSNTSERTFSALKRLVTYLRSTMTEKRLNNCFLLHIHKELTDQLDLTSS